MDGMAGLPQAAAPPPLPPPTSRRAANPARPAAGGRPPAAQTVQPGWRSLPAWAALSRSWRRCRMPATFCSRVCTFLGASLCTVQSTRVVLPPDPLAPRTHFRPLLGLAPYSASVEVASWCPCSPLAMQTVPHCNCCPPRHAPLRSRLVPRLRAVHRCCQGDRCDCFGCLAGAQSCWPSGSTFRSKPACCGWKPAGGMACAATSAVLPPNVRLANGLLAAVAVPPSLPVLPFQSPIGCRALWRRQARSCCWWMWRTRLQVRCGCSGGPLSVRPARLMPALHSQEDWLVGNLCCPTCLQTLCAAAQPLMRASSRAALQVPL